MQLPFYVKASVFTIGLLALFSILYIAQSIILPIVFSIIIAILLSPIVSFFTRKKINRIIAISITLLLTFIIIVGVGLLIFSQVKRFSKSWPIIVDKFMIALNQGIVWTSGYLDITTGDINQWLTIIKVEIINISSSAIGETLITVGSSILILILVPVYIFMILYYQPLLLEFIHKLFSKDRQKELNEIITQTKTVIQRYLLGLIIESSIVATLNSLGLLMLGIEYAILFGIIGGLLNVIPYIGGVVSVSLPMMIALSTKSPSFAVYVLLLWMVIQFADNHYIIPKIVASKVKINALFSIIVVLAGNALWGIPGMLLSIPLLAIVKLIFDHIESLKPWGFLLGDTMPTLIKFRQIIKKSKK